MWKRINDILQPVLAKINLSFFKSYKTLIIAVLVGGFIVSTAGGLFTYKYFQDKTATLQREREEKENSLEVDRANSPEKQQNDNENESTNGANTPPSDEPTQTTIKPTIPVTKTVPPPANAESPNITYTTSQAQTYVESIILSLVNAERRRVGVGTLTPVPQLAQAADIRAGEEAVIGGAPDHTRPNGSNFSTIFAQVGYTGYTAWGENLTWGYQAQFTYNKTNLDYIANRMYTNWKNSPGHYANMIRSNFNQTGIGVKLTNQSERTYWWGIQLFAQR
jgi:uncharacterized protein YkwD